MDVADNEARHLVRLYWVLTRLMDRELAPLDLGHGRYLYLFGLYIADGRKQRELAEIIGTDKAAVTRALVRLERSGYIRRRSDPRDGRVTRVFLTPKGRKLRPRLEAAADNAIEALTEPLDRYEREALRELLARMAMPHIEPKGNAIK